MMTEPLRVSVVAAPLAAIDPRALSQAWYSALHLARAGDAGSSASHALQRVQMRAPRISPTAAHVARLQPERLPLSPAYRAGWARTASSDTFAHRIRSALARRIESALARRAGAAARATFVVADGSKRALIVVQTRGSSTHLVAVCAPAQREAIARALAQVRGSLQARGIVLYSRIENAACS
jgi:hypothetical protein